MAETSSAKSCDACSAAVEPTATFCSRCGWKLTTAPTLPQPPRAKWYHNIWLVLLMLFFVLGPFGLPLVWSNPRFSRTVKIALTAATLLYTVWLLQVTMQMVHAVTTSLQDFNATLHF